MWEKLCAASVKSKASWAANIDWCLDVLPDLFGNLEFVGSAGLLLLRLFDLAKKGVEEYLGVDPIENRGVGVELGVEYTKRCCES